MLLSRLNTSAISTYKFAVLSITCKTQEARSPGRRAMQGDIQVGLRRPRAMQEEAGDGPAIAERDK